MNRTRKRMERLMRFIEKLKNNEYPNAESFASYLSKVDVEENIDIASSSKSIKRDIAYLRDSFNAPIKYCPLNKGYYLEYSWNLPMTEMTSDELFATLFSSKIVEKMLPSLLRQYLRNSTQKHLAVVESDDMSVNYLNSLIMATNFNVEINPDVVKKVIEAWKKSQLLKITYRSPRRKVNENLTIEPHGLFTFENLWYIKAYSRETEDVRNYAFHRIREITTLNDTFYKRHDIIDHLQSGDNIFGYETIDKVKCRVKKEHTEFMVEKAWFPGQENKILKDGSAELTFHNVPHEDFIQWVLRNQSMAEVVEPKKIRREVREEAKKLYELHG